MPLIYFASKDNPMPNSRSQNLTQLSGPWAGFVDGICVLSEHERQAYLTKQGYARVGDLLAHLMAWWRLGMQQIERYQADPHYQPGPVNVDAFNAAAVAQAADCSDAQILADFEAARQGFGAFIQSLPESALADPRVQKQIEMELFGHYGEHAVSKT
jgi:hypothetical protein